MAKLRLSLGCPPYDRTEALRTGEVEPEGIEIVYLSMPPAEAHARMLKNQEFDISDMSMSHYLTSRASGKAPFTAIPIFPMRRFFHTEMLVNTSSGIKVPSDLKGKKIGIQEYGMTMALWIRGILEHEFGVKPSDVDWFLERSPGEKVGDSFEFKPPQGVRIHQVPADSSLMNLLVAGEIDAAFHYPRIFKTRRERETRLDQSFFEKTRPLFPDTKQESIRYYKKTGFYPINHTVVIKNEILKENPWVALSLYEAFLKAKIQSYEKLYSRRGAPTNIIFLDNLVDENKEIFGEDAFPYGLKANEKILDAMLTYSYEQGLTPRKARLDELFFRTTLDL